VGHQPAHHRIIVDVVDLFVLLLVTPDIHVVPAPVPNPVVGVMMHGRGWRRDGMQSLRTEPGPGVFLRNRRLQKSGVRASREPRSQDSL
jgi:hypothetical protein